MLVPEALEGSRTTSHQRSISNKLPATDERDNGGSRRPQGSVREKSPTNVEQSSARATLMPQSYSRPATVCSIAACLPPRTPVFAGLTASKLARKRSPPASTGPPISPPRPGPKRSRDHQQRSQRLRRITTIQFNHAKAGKQARVGDHLAELRNLISPTSVTPPPPTGPPGRFRSPRSTSRWRRRGSSRARLQVRPCSTLLR